MANDRNPVVRLDGVEFSLARRQLLGGVGFEVESGSGFAVIGHNGAGKTTLFHLLLGLKFPDRGSISIFGIPASDPRAREAVGYVPERPYLDLDLTLREVLTLHADLTGIGRSLQSAEILRVSREVGLEAHLGSRLRTFSKGMLQKTLIAQALIGNPRVMILDEPMSGLDPETRETLKGWFRTWKASGRTVIFSTHALEDVGSLADNVLVLKGGRVEFLGTEAQWKERR